MQGYQHSSHLLPEPDHRDDLLGLLALCGDTKSCQQRDAVLWPSLAHSEERTMHVCNHNHLLRALLLWTVLHQLIRLLHGSQDWFTLYVEHDIHQCLVV